MEAVRRALTRLLDLLAKEVAAELDKAMRQYIRAISQGDVPSFLSLVPRTKPFEFVVYEITTLKKAETTQITLQMLAADFKAKGDTYSTFFGDVDEGPYIYRLTVIQTPFEKWRKEGKLVARLLEEKGVPPSLFRWLEVVKPEL